MLLFALLYCSAVVGIGVLAGRVADWRSRSAGRRRPARPRSRVKRTGSRCAAADHGDARAPAVNASPTQQPEPMVDIPVSMPEQFIESLARLEVLERRESMRLVQRELRKAATRTRL